MITIRELGVNEAEELAALLSRQRNEYVQHFRPFPFDAETLGKRISSAVRDRYWALVWSGELAGFAMLRGWDEGYAKPSFGVFVAEEFSGKGLAREALRHAVSFAYDAGCPAMILKVHPENPRARAIYEGAGFLKTGRCAQTGQELMELRFDAQTAAAAAKISEG